MTGWSLIYYALGWFLFFTDTVIDFVIKDAPWGYYAIPGIGLFFFIIKFAIDWSEREY